MARYLRLLTLTLFAAASALALAQAGPGALPFKSYEVHPDHTVTFRYLNPAAKSVGLGLDIDAKPLPMTRDDSGVWSVTTPPLPPEIYGYSFVVDGVQQLDPYNINTHFNYAFLGNQFLVPATPPAPWELTDIPHGRIDHIRFTTHIAQNLPADQSAYSVYLPPHYDAHRKGGYPVLYLLHGWSDNETAWADVGHAGDILDHLIDSGKAVPMIVVMPFGYGDLHFVLDGWSVWGKPDLVMNNDRLFADELLHEVMPAVDSAYNVAPGRDNQAIAGLSMGGQESLTIGLEHPDQFAYVIGMSAAIHNTPYTAMQPADAATKPEKPRLLWVACGTSDALITPNRAFVAWAKTNGLNPVAVETPGLHTWEVWRDNLLQFAPLLFR